MAKYQALDERETEILRAAEVILLDEGYSALTMDRLVEATACPKGTMYRRFACKEDVVLALAQDCLRRRGAMLRRGAAYPGKSRERFLALGEAVSLFSRLHPNDSKLIHLATGAMREKCSEERLKAVEQIERITGDLTQQIALDGLAAGELRLPEGSVLSEVTLAFWALVEGGFTLIENGIPQGVLRLHNPLHHLWRSCNLLADSYGWRPLFREWDYEQTLADIRREVFPQEAQQLYGPEGWQGDDA